MLDYSKLNKKILDYIFVVSKQPILYKDLLQANALFNEGMYVDPAKLNFRIDFKKAYIAYALICSSILVPLLLLSHIIFVNIDFHFSIVGTIIVTASVFIGFDIFKLRTRKIITKELIMKAWSVHFPYFPYEKYSKKVEKLYNQAINENLPKHNLEHFILDGLSKD